MSPESAVSSETGTVKTAPASKLASVFARCKAEGRAALIGYLPVGYPTVEKSIESFRTMVEAGCDIIEVGVPYSDPVMDGPTIQEAAELALTNGVRVRDVFTAVKSITDAGGAAVVMSYWNPVLKYGVDRFAHDLAEAGGAGMITPNLIPEEDRPGTRRPTSTVSTASTWSHRRRPPSGSRSPSTPPVASCTPPPPWV